MSCYAAGRKVVAGFTLLELVVAVAILAVLAGLVVGKFDWSRRQADMAASASSCCDLGSNIQTYLNEVGHFPDGMDTLLDTSGQRYSKIIASAPDMTKMTTVETFNGADAADGRIASMSRIGIKMAFDHDPASTDASSSGTVPRTYNRTGSNVMLCVTPGSALWNQIYPVGLPESQIDETNGSLVVMGIGPGCSMIGKTLLSAPLYPGGDPTTQYQRYMVIFAAYKNTNRAQLKCVVDSYGRTIAGALSNYGQATPE